LFGETNFRGFLLNYETEQLRRNGWRAAAQVKASKSNSAWANIVCFVEDLTVDQDNKKPMIKKSVCSLETDDEFTVRLLRYWSCNFFL